MTAAESEAMLRIYDSTAVVEVMLRTCDTATGEVGMLESCGFAAILVSCGSAAKCEATLEFEGVVVGIKGGAAVLCRYNMKCSDIVVVVLQ